MEAKKDRDLRLAQIAGYVAASGGAKSVDVYRIAGYHRQQTAAMIDPEVAQMEAIAVREALRQKALDEAHERWLAEVNLDG